MSQSTATKSKKKEIAKGITSISVNGYKSLYEECCIEVRPLTILAGANSSGKSSIMQPLLMLKQTLEATYDPGALLLNGPNVKFTSATQLFSKVFGRERITEFTIYIEVENNESIKNTFIKYPRKAIDVLKMEYEAGGKKLVISPDMLPGDVIKILPEPYLAFYELAKEVEALQNQSRWIIERNRCFLEFALLMGKKTMTPSFLQSLNPTSPSETFGRYISQTIHVPGLRGNPERNYKTTAIGSEFPGTFENYVASVINHWQKNKDKRLQDLGDILEALGLTWKVEAKQVDDTQVELRVGRLPRHSSTKSDVVSIADVGFGVSQTLPVIVALLVAEPGQLVYIEQPEIHLHPRAQAALAEVFAYAANRGVKVVIETHSALLLLAVQSLVAEGKLSPQLVKLHWFTRKEDGITKVSSTDLDDTGAFGDWPEDFGDVSLSLESRYLNAAEARLFNNSHGN
ncbi:AAA family ATPase [Tolypothrix sp. LEGE 11397]|uniref:AAA family ATPase n=1 Tax=unclassified Tolypothrix TaxID=2649714 RepID=UPI000B5F2A2B|nr:MULTISPECIES: AAA family ATPase [unclassified Tolypothrix]MBE9086330.1 AAA family ATPase [Tolypothrix sp. LEGE 11397]UYD26765.1 AAA family ATPase [Tolypothrix sp. PCC 7712]UYD37378.1 AAA family ATPase [Tolypothrix sp. PCC 7601]BAY92850.1 hypothetical protein NIES3275_48870 [Microchaete diplosiphon NIES-3275]